MRSHSSAPAFSPARDQVQNCLWALLHCFVTLLCCLLCSHCPSAAVVTPVCKLRCCVELSKFAVKTPFISSVLWEALNRKEALNLAYLFFVEVVESSLANQSGFATGVIEESRFSTHSDTQRLTRDHSYLSIPSPSFLYIRGAFAWCISRNKSQS